MQYLANENQCTNTDSNTVIFIPVCEYTGVQTKKFLKYNCIQSFTVFKLDSCKSEHTEIPSWF